MSNLAGSERLADALVRAGVIAPNDMSSIQEITIRAVAGAPVSLHVKRVGDARLAQALAELRPGDVQVTEDTREEVDGG